MFGKCQKFTDLPRRTSIDAAAVLLFELSSSALHVSALRVKGKRMGREKKETDEESIQEIEHL